MIAPLRHRTFRLLFGGQLVSNLGDWLDFAFRRLLRPRTPFLSDNKELHVQRGYSHP